MLPGGYDSDGAGAAATAMAIVVVAMAFAKPAASVTKFGVQLAAGVAGEASISAAEVSCTRQCGTGNKRAISGV